MRISYKPKYERIRQHERALLMRKQGKRAPKEAIKALPAAQIIWALRAHVKALLIDFNRLPLEYRNLKIEDDIKDEEIDALYGVLIKRDLEIAKLKDELQWDQEIREDLASGVLDYYSGENIKIREQAAEIHALEAQNEHLHKHLSERLIQIIKLKDELAVKDDEIGALHQLLTECNAEIKRVTEAKLNVNLAKLHAENEHLKAENEQISILTLRYMRGLDAEQMRNLPVSEKFALVERLQAELARMK
jgi:chromosome segregation ATPase